MLRSQGSSGALTVAGRPVRGSPGRPTHAGERNPDLGDGDVTARKLEIPIKQDTAIEAPETINLTLTPDTALSVPSSRRASATARRRS